MNITIWERFNKEKQEYEHNHIESGHVSGDKPKPKHSSFKGQNDWVNHEWRKTHGKLENNIVKVNV